MEEFIIAQQNLLKNDTMEFMQDDPDLESWSQRLLRAAPLVDKFYTPLLCLFGTLGNSLSLAVFCTDGKYQNQSASMYLSALAISDTGFLLSLFVLWLEGVVQGGGIITSSDFSCALVMYLGQVTCFLSVYLTVAFSIERYVAVHFPFSRPRICTRAKARKAVASMTIVALLLFSYVWVIAKVIKYPSNSRNVTSGKYNDSSLPLPSDFYDLHNQLILSSGNDTNSTTSAAAADIFSGNSIEVDPTVEPQNDENNYDANDDLYVCSVPPQFYKVSEIANYLDTTVTFVIPFFLITFFNIRIAACVWRLKHQRQGIVATSSRKFDASCHFNGIAKFHDRTRRSCRQHSRNHSSPEEGSTYETVQFESFYDAANSKPPISQNGNRLQAPSSQARVSRVKLNVSSTRNESFTKCSHTSPEVRVTKVLLLVSSVFLILNLPSHVIRCAQFIQVVTGTGDSQELLRLLQPWSNILFNTNFAVNFLLYCVCGKNFRLSLHNLMLRTFQRRAAHENRRRRVIKERLNGPGPQSQWYSTTLTTGVRESCNNGGVAGYRQLELGSHNGNALDSYKVHMSSLQSMDEEMEQIASV